MSEKLMTDEELDEHFRSLIDTFIDHANELAANSSPQNVSLAMLHAASRYNAFVVSSHAESLADFERDQASARKYFLSRYTEMLDENLEDYKSIYQ